MPSVARPTTATASRVSTRAASRSQSHGFGSFADIFDAFFGGDPFGGVVRARRRGRGPGRRRGGGGRDLARRGGARARRSRSPTTLVDACEHCHGNGAEPGTPIETCAHCGGAGRVRAVTRTAFGQLVREQACDACGGEGRIPSEPCHECQGRGRRAVRKTLQVDVPPGHRRRAAHPPQRPRPRRRARRPGGRPLRARARERGRALPARRQRPRDRGRRARAGGGARHDGLRADAGRRRGDRRARRHPARDRGDAARARDAHHRPRAARRPAGGAERGDPAQPHAAPERAARGAARLAHRREPRGAPTSRCSRRSGGRCADPPGQRHRLSARHPGARRARRARARRAARARAGGRRAGGRRRASWSSRSTARPASCPTLPTGRPTWPACGSRSPARRSATTGRSAGAISTTRAGRRRFYVRPPWSEPLADGIDIVIDPGQAFGTGAHPTTRMCSSCCSSVERRGALVDLGCGSGVLAIAAAKLGFAPVTASTTTRPRSRPRATTRGQRSGARARRAPRPAHGAGAGGARS